MAEDKDTTKLIEELTKELGEYQRWVDDLQSGMYINCVYCGHRYGPQDEVAESMSEVLKKHIEQCPKHPLSARVKDAMLLREALHQVYGMAPPVSAIGQVAITALRKTKHLVEGP